MASISSQRVGTSISWTLQWARRSRSISFALSFSERTRSHHRTSNHRQHHHHSEYRHFSTQPHRSAEAPAPSRPSSSTAPPPPAKVFTPPPSSASVAPTPAKVSTPPPSTTTAPPRPTPPAISVTHRFTPRQPPPQTARQIDQNRPQEPLRELQVSGLSDLPPVPKIDDPQEAVDWTRSFYGLSSESFSKEAQEILLKPLTIDDIEVKPEGLIYLPEIKYRRILNKAFGPGGWGLAPRGETIVTAKCVTREYALLANGRLVSIARGEQDYFDLDGIPTATEGCKSNALMRCCKDLGVASELWDPRYIRKYMAEHAKEVWVEHAVTKKKKKITMRKDDSVKYPYKEVKMGASGTFGT